ncbi:J domain-containing protein [Sneathiella limimaris]|uniref:J domain-containing protein n=1 Tax=Sneathiella limimaris TaxID=1964213 RepID=UPI00146DECCF|nr:J domain-containing protein [Sneathiella limimaris]
MKKFDPLDLKKSGQEAMRLCAKDGCPEPGEFRAPKSRLMDRGSDNDYQWLCLAHIREFNKNWNFFDGMSDDEVLHYKTEDITGHRPTWKLGSRAGRPKADVHYDDPFEFQRDGEFGEYANRRQQHQDTNGTENLDEAHRQALATLNLEPGCTIADIKKRRNELAKKFHPDIRGGDKQAEEILKTINQAYTHLLSCTPS